MRHTIILLFFLIARIASASDYYISADGNDSSDGRTPESSWKTIQKVNSEFFKIVPGDRILFKRGDTFYGTLKISKSGMPGKPVTIGAYGTGPDPVISGFTEVRSWTPEGSGLFAATIICESSPNMVIINGVNTPMGRWPDSDLLTIDSSISNSSITDSELSSSPDWTGAEIVIRKNDFIWDRNTITNQSGSTIRYNSGSYYEAKKGFGYFIQNDLKTLSQPGEWFCRGNDFFMFFGEADPEKSRVLVSCTDQLVYIDGKNHITFDGLAFEGANIYAFQIRNSANITIRNCNINFTGGTAIYGPWWGSSPFCEISNTTIDNSNSNGIKLLGDHTNATISGNIVRNTGVTPGMGGSGDSNYSGVMVLGKNSLIKNNTVENSGYMGIYFGGENTRVENNFINRFNLIKNDGGGIYTYVGTDPPVSGQSIAGNIVINGEGSGAGTPGKELQATGIYVDDRARDIKITGNTVAGCSTAGIYLHNAHEIEITGNTLYSNGSGRNDYGCQILMVHDKYSPDDPIRNIKMSGNILFAKNSPQKILAFSTPDNSISKFGVSDNNYFIGEPGKTGIFRIWEKGWNVSATDLSLSGWQMKTTNDSNSKLAPDPVSDIKDIRFKQDPANPDNVVTKEDMVIHPDFSDVRFEYNSSGKTRIICLEKSYVDVKGSKFEHCIELLPYSSVILISIREFIAK